jgi:hypothetical protein
MSVVMTLRTLRMIIVLASIRHMSVSLSPYGERRQGDTPT